jgi:hypothetical protein
LRSVQAGSDRVRRPWTAVERRIGDATRPALVRWEALPGHVQFLVTLPIAVVLLFFFHVIVFNLTAFRSFFYALFWGIPVTIIVVAASRNEALKRARARDGDPPADE